MLLCHSSVLATSHLPGYLWILLQMEVQVQKIFRSRCCPWHCVSLQQYHRDIRPVTFLVSLQFSIFASSVFLWIFALNCLTPLFQGCFHLPNQLVLNYLSIFLFIIFILFFKLVTYHQYIPFFNFSASLLISDLILILQECIFRAKSTFIEDTQYWQFIIEDRQQRGSLVPLQIAS